MKSPVPGDQGPLKAALRRVPDRRAMVLDMARPVTFLLLTPVEAPALITVMRVKVKQWFGDVRYNGAELARYVRCSADTQRRLVRLAPPASPRLAPPSQASRARAGLARPCYASPAAPGPAGPSQATTRPA